MAKTSSKKKIGKLKLKGAPKTGAEDKVKSKIGKLVKAF
jgi:hypothetical protein